MERHRHAKTNNEKRRNWCKIKLTVDVAKIKSPDCPEPNHSADENGFSARTTDKDRINFRRYITNNINAKVNSFLAIHTLFIKCMYDPNALFRITKTKGNNKGYSGKK